VVNAIDSLFAAVREAQDQQLHLADANEHARARARLLQVVERPDMRATATPVAVSHRGALLGSMSRWGLGGLAAAACALAIFVAMPERGEREVAIDVLEFELDGAELGPNQSISADAQPRLLAVSDSTRIELAPHGVMHVEEIRSNGATVVLERGEVSLAVHHEVDTSWRVAAGPWTVHVTGTQFVVAWEPSAEHFRVAVTEGSVRVEGPEGQVEQLGAGQEMVRARGKATLEPETLGASEVATLDSDEGEELEPEHGGNAPISKPSKPTAPRWDRYFEDADYQAAWEALADQPGGIHGEAERVDDAKTMLDLADVARFTKHASDTRKLLELLRERFPDSNEAGEAAFVLGRLAADGGSHAKAAVWFERYLDERPSGSFAADALGRLIDCYDALGQADDAKSAAQRYLASHPKGPHAAKAEKILAQ
jgi:ferric-dicitrate binding protein FerR (iron transport regulator)